ncbi:hypothetical protein KDA14_04945, partial [Candidatus Saccharibacteria bacterium]|nr:hypothetical protein [Candidatus Saccharibacteria bacterium]
MAVDILKGFEFPTLSDTQKMFLMEDGAVTLTQRRQIEHSGDNGTITSPYTFVDADAGGLFVLSDRAKYLRLYSTLNNGVLPPIYIREVVDADTLRLNTPKLVSDTGVSWDLLSYKETYPLDLDLVAKSPLWTAEESVALLNFEAVTTEPTGTSVKFRLTDDGITYQYWDGAAWSAATLDAHWSTAADIDTNIGTFDFSKQTLGFAAQLLTTDPLA